MRFRTPARAAEGGNGERLRGAFIVKSHSPPGNPVYTVSRGYPNARPDQVCRVITDEIMSRTRDKQTVVTCQYPAEIENVRVAAGEAAVTGGSRIVGEWRGSSTCLNLQVAPACKDEIVRYVFSASSSDPNTFHVVADKLIAGAYQPMGEFDLLYSDKDGEWTYQFDSPNCPHCRWWYRVDSSGLTGGIFNQAGIALRKVSATRRAP